MSLFALTLPEMCDPRTHTFDHEAFRLVMEADPAVTSRLMAKLTDPQFHKTPYWRVCLMAAAKFHHCRCHACGGLMIPTKVSATFPPPMKVQHGTEHTRLAELHVVHLNRFRCKAVEARKEKP